MPSTNKTDNLNLSQFIGIDHFDPIADYNNDMKAIDTSVKSLQNLKADKSLTVNGHELNEDVVVSKSDIGLGNVDNTSDENKPVSMATQTELDQKVNKTQKINGHVLSGDIILTQSDIGGSSLPDGGTTGQVLAKKSDTDYDVNWINQTGGGSGGDGSYVSVSEKGAPSGVATLDESGHIPPEQMNLNYSGKLIVHVVSSDGGSITGTRVRVRNEQLGSNYVQDLDALANTTFSLFDNHTYYVVLLDYPATYYGAAATVQITGGETQTLTLTLKTTPDIVGWREKVTTGEVEYIEGATDFQPMSVTDGTTDFGSWGENWICDMRPCLLKNGVVQYYLKQTGTLTFDYTKQANGTASDITSGDDGDVMIEFPRKYYKTYLANEANGDVYMYWMFAQTPVDDTWCANAWMNEDGIIQDTMYLAAYDGVEFNGKLRSLSGVTPTVSKTIGEFRTLANANGAGYEQQEWSKRVYVQALLPLFFKGLDSQALVGLGRTDGSNSSAINTGTMNSKPLIWGDQTGTNGVKFCGIENFWGNIYKFCDGLINVQNVYKYKIYGPYNDTADGYLDAGTIGGTTGEYIDTMQAANGYGMLPATTVSDETSSKFHDYFWKGTSDTYVCRTGGAWDGGASVGAFSLNLNSSASNVATSIGGALSYTPV